ncbi:hypothetical protein AOQ84DRAFT_343406 [Glonium stellatum]|uniref:BTB domain-containing protein n=1 Tax=Glonium stellatum TaxID=574774 RepID=A0A8E2EWW2_9PEZI|nr:hypothetical protein AOQ84DRAFT_343406 [Glonium stellatum]
MEGPEDEALSKNIKIVPDGDLILVVGPEKARLRVHSLFLKTVSKHFSAMFKPVWKEGHNMIGQDSPVELPLPEDDAATLELICAVIHHQVKLVPQTLSPDKLLKVAIMVDKYDCVDSLNSASASWFRSCKAEAEDLMRVAAAAYLFNNAQAFKESTKALILNYGGSYLALPYEDIKSIIPWRIFLLLEEQRSFVRLKIAGVILNPNDPSISCIYSYEKNVEYRWDNASRYTTNGRSRLVEMDDSIGLCLHCFRSGSTESSYCRKKH